MSKPEKVVTLDDLDVAAAVPSVDQYQERASKFQDIINKYENCEQTEEDAMDWDELEQKCKEFDKKHQLEEDNDGESEDDFVSETEENTETSLVPSTASNYEKITYHFDPNVINAMLQTMNQRTAQIDIRNIQFLSTRESSSLGESRSETNFTTPNSSYSSRSESKFANLYRAVSTSDFPLTSPELNFSKFTLNGVPAFQSFSEPEQPRHFQGITELSQHIQGMLGLKQNITIRFHERSYDIQVSGHEEPTTSKSFKEKLKFNPAPKLKAIKPIIISDSDSGSDQSKEKEILELSDEKVPEIEVKEVQSDGKKSKSKLFNFEGEETASETSARYSSSSDKCNPSPQKKKKYSKKVKDVKKSQSQKKSDEDELKRKLNVNRNLMGDQPKTKLVASEESRKTKIAKATKSEFDTKDQENVNKLQNNEKPEKMKKTSKKAQQNADKISSKSEKVPKKRELANSKPEVGAAKKLREIQQSEIAEIQQSENQEQEELYPRRTIQSVDKENDGQELDFIENKMSKFKSEDSEELEDQTMLEDVSCGSSCSTITSDDEKFFQMRKFGELRLEKQTNHKLKKLGQRLGRKFKQLNIAKKKYEVGKKFVKVEEKPKASKPSTSKALEVTKVQSKTLTLEDQTMLDEISCGSSCSTITSDDEKFFQRQKYEGLRKKKQENHKMQKFIERTAVMNETKIREEEKRKLPEKSGNSSSSDDDDDYFNSKWCSSNSTKK